MSSYSKYKDLGENKDAPTPEQLSVVPLIQSHQQKIQFIKTHKLCVVDIYGDWCGPCKAIAGRYAELAKQFGSPGKCILVKEDVDMELTGDVRGVPMFQFFLNGQYHSSIVGADIKNVEKKIIELLTGL